VNPKDVVREMYAPIWLTLGKVATGVAATLSYGVDFFAASEQLGGLLMTMTAGGTFYIPPFLHGLGIVVLLGPLASGGQ
jgi:hypothetical protein